MARLEKRVKEQDSDDSDDMKDVETLTPAQLKYYKRVAY